MTPEQAAREAIDARLLRAGWAVQDYGRHNVAAGYLLYVNRLMPLLKELNEVLVL